VHEPLNWFGGASRAFLTKRPLKDAPGPMFATVEGNVRRILGLLEDGSDGRRVVHGCSSYAGDSRQRESLSAGGANKLWVGFKKQDVRQTQAGWS
jgi:hypothetical protein